MKFLHFFAIVLSIAKVQSQTYDPYCRQYANTGECIKCIDFFVIKNKICTKISASCDSYDHNTGECTTCVQGFQLNNGKCQGPIEGYNQTHQNQSAVSQFISVQPVNLHIATAQQIVAQLPYKIQSASPFINLQPKKLERQLISSSKSSLTSLSLSDSIQQSGSLLNRQIIHQTSTPSSTLNNSLFTITQATTIKTQSGNSQPSLPPSSNIHETQQQLKTSDNPYGYPPGFQDPYCQQYDQNNHCIKCASRFYFSSQSGLCTPVNSQCNTFNQISGSCLSCYPGYSLNNQNCIISVTAQSTINSVNLCRTLVNNICTSCYGDNTLVNGVCVSSLSLCQSIDSQNNCIGCYSGYSLVNGRCVAVSTEGCSKFSTQGRCIQCSKGFFFQGGICIQSNTLCQTFNPQNGACLSCYPGYIISGTSCSIEISSIQNDPNCASFKNGTCEKCSLRFFMKQGRCYPVNDYCNTYDNISGDCTSCYSGFLLRDGFCYKTIIVPSTQVSSQTGVSGNVYTQTQAQQQAKFQIKINNKQQQTTRTQIPIQIQINKTIQHQQSPSLPSLPALSELPSLPILQPQLPQLPQLPNISQNQISDISNRVSIRTQNSTTNLTSEQLFYQWLNKDDKHQQQVILTQKDKQTLDGQINNTNSTINYHEQIKIQQIKTVNTPVALTNQQKNKQFSLSQSLKHEIITPSLSTQAIQIPSISLSNINSQSFVISNNPCIKLDNDGFTCLQCSPTWTLSYGSCLLGEIKPLEVYPIHDN